MEALVLQAFDVALHATTRAAFTIYEIFFRPSETAKAYIDGRRQTYQSPVALFTLGYLLLYFTIEFLTSATGASVSPGNIASKPLPTAPQLDVTLTALGKPIVFVGMCLIATVSHYVVVYPKLFLAETVACFLYVYASAFVFAIPIVIAVALNTAKLPTEVQQMRFLVVDGPVIAFIIVQCIRMSRFIGVSRMRILLATAFGIAYFAVMRLYFGIH